MNVQTDPHLQIQSEETSTDMIDDLDLPITVRKGTRECTKQPL